MRIVVCAKEVLDPEGINSYALWGRLTVDESGRSFDTGGTVSRIINAYDEQALEAALRLRDVGVDCQITVVTVGSEESGNILRRCVAMGADSAVHIHDPAPARADGFRTARVLAGFIRELGDVDLVLCGRQGSDYDQGVVPGVLAELLGAALVTIAADVRPADAGIEVTRITPLGAEVVRASLPAVISVSNELGTPRYPSSRGMMSARRTPPQRREASEFLPEGPGQALELVAIQVPDVQGHCEMIEAETPEEKARRLLERLAERGLLRV